MKIDPPRPLSAEEQYLLDLVLSPDFAGAEELREQAKSVLVTGGCDCGCPSVDLRAQDGACATGSASQLVPSELEIVSADDEPPGQIILFAHDGRLSYLEYVYFGETPHTWPDPSRVRIAGS